MDLRPILSVVINELSFNDLCDEQLREIILPTVSATMV